MASYLNTSSRWAPSESGVEPLADNILLNGQHVYDCSVESTTYPADRAALDRGADFPPSDGTPPCSPGAGRLYRTEAPAGARLRLRLINASSFLSYWFSIDNHTLTVVELDGVEIEPLHGQRGLLLNIGQRASVVVALDQAPGNYYLRATLPRTCFLPYSPYTSAGLASSGYEARGLLSYAGAAAADAAPLGRPGNTSNPYGVANNGARGDVWEGCDNLPFSMPKPMRRMDALEVSDANTHYIEYTFRQAQDVNRIFINKASPPVPPTLADLPPFRLLPQRAWLFIFGTDRLSAHTRRPTRPSPTTRPYGRPSTSPSPSPRPIRTTAVSVPRESRPLSLLHPRH